MDLVFKIVGVAEWRAAEIAGVFAGSQADRADGFIHLSSAAQAPQTAAKWFNGRHDLALVAINADAIGADLKWEPSRGGDLFPHLYGPLPISAVVWSRAVLLDEHGRHRFGDLTA